MKNLFRNIEKCKIFFCLFSFLERRIHLTETIYLKIGES